MALTRRMWAIFRSLTVLSVGHFSLGCNMSLQVWPASFLFSHLPGFDFITGRIGTCPLIGLKLRRCVVPEWDR